ncbi:phage regulatory protein/antirepressor Ant [Sporosarcina saromensis]|uniref:Phage regulatory protein/antirepressor Ant n=1 Tax=Sporosarcina saromensis TaxID=359365 RepID=A0ABU4GBX0_9BACL|nr:phage regulatory protein/antirepressor Ant [Sporosarcina saromensis]MDW0113813.1 phage regulatory protein/antirepressor Ant [Sporosarcina saromensis]
MSQLVIMQDRQAVTSSLQVAESFEKQHKHVLESIDRTIKDEPDSRPMFFETSEPDSYGRDRRVILMNRDGFSLIAMGFTGKKAMQFKLSFIRAFNELEEALKPKLPTNYKEALLQLVAAEEEKEQLQLENKILDQRVSELEPKATYVDEVLKSTDLMVTTQIAEDYGMTAIAFNKLLNKHGIQYKMNGQWLLYAEHKGLGYTKSETTKFKKKDGTEGTSLLTKWTQKGRLFIYQTLKMKGVLPTMEKTKLTLIESEREVV